MVTATESCLPNSDTIFQCRNDDGVREEYYTQLLRKTGQHNHNIAVGDIYAIRDMEEGTKSLPFLKDVKSVFGQVLALCVKKEAVGRNSYHVVVRRLARWKSEAPNFATKKALKRAEKAGYFRPDQALLETMKVETHCVSDILRADIRLVDSKKFIDTDRIPVEWHQDTEAWDVSLCCPCRIDETDTVHDVRVDWNNYESCRTTTASNSDASSSIPKALMRGWQLLTIKGLEEALKSGWTGRLGAVFSVEQDTLPKPVEQQLPSSKNKKRKSKEVMPGATSLSVPSKKKKKTNQRVHFASMSRSSQQYTDCTTATETSIESPKTIGNSVASVPLHPTPLGDPVFTTSAKASSSIVYVEGVEMDVDEATVVADRKRKKPKRRWQFHVGDLVILRCDEAHPPKSPFVAKKPAWFPFKVRWSVAQIVAMYYRKGNESDFKMQVRWFYRPDELNEAVQKHLTDEQTVEFFDGKDESRMLVEVDEHVNEVPVESAVGHANLTSEVRPSRQWLRVNTKAAVPEVGFICRYAYMSENDDPRLYSVHDWTGYGISSSGPLYRGLSCPKCVTGTTPKLYQRYKTRLCTRLKIDGLQVSDVVREQRDTEKLAMEWSEVEFGCARASCKPADCCHGDNQQEFFSSVNIQIVKERCDARGTAKKSEYQEVKVSIGDFVCITSTFEVVVRTQIDLAGNRERNRWFPYKGPFVYVQVLSIFRKSDTRSNAVMLEVRRFLRRSEVTSIATKYLPPDCARQHEEEVFESFEVEVIPAGRVLGIAEMFLGHHTESCRTLTTDRPLLQNEIPQPKCRCTFFLTAVALQKLFCADSTPLKWTRRMLQRGLGASKLIQSDSELAASIEFCLGISIGSGKNDSNNLFMGLIQEAKKSAPASLPLFKKAVGEASEHSIFSSVSIEIPWSRYSEADRLCSARDRKDCWWKICVGDAIAIRKEGAAGRPSLYTSNWEPAQVLAIRSSDSRNGTYEFVVQRLRRSVTAPSKHSFPDRVSDAIGNSASVLLASDLIGPVYATKENHITSVWGSKAVPYLPTNVVVYESMAQFSFSAFVRKALECTSLYTRQELRLLYDALEGELIDFSAQDESLDPLPQTLSSSASDLMAPTAKDLFYTDRNGVRYYKRLILEPSMYNIVEEIRAGRDRVDGPWSVELGDAVVVEYSHGYGEAKFGGSLCSTQGRRTKSFPFVKPWGIGEVVSIFVPKQMADSDEISIEIELRWYYRAPEIKGAVAVLDQSSYNVCEEVFESDHYDSCSASSLRGPALVHEKPTSLGRRRLHLGMPVLEFSSSRFWSPRRSSLVPIESSELARIQRGRLHSPRIMKDAELRNALETLGGLTLQDSPSKRKNWRSNFHDAIQKLSLTDASKEGFKSSKAIIGRDKEMSQILSFLRTALKGNNKDGRCSLFIAGPVSVWTERYVVHCAMMLYLTAFFRILARCG